MADVDVLRPAADPTEVDTVEDTDEVPVRLDEAVEELADAIPVSAEVPDCNWLRDPLAEVVDETPDRLPMAVARDEPDEVQVETIPVAAHVAVRLETAVELDVPVIPITDEVEGNRDDPDEIDVD